MPSLIYEVCVNMHMRITAYVSTLRSWPGFVPSEPTTGTACSGSAHMPAEKKLTPGRFGFDLVKLRLDDVDEPLYVLDGLRR